MLWSRVVHARSTGSKPWLRSRPELRRHPTQVPGNSLLVTFEPSPSGGGTKLKMTESGYREMGWEFAVLEQQYQEHVTGWDAFLPRLAPYVATLEVRR